MKQLPEGDAIRLPFEEIPPEVPIDPYGKRKGYQSWQQTIRRISMMTAQEVADTYRAAVTDLEKYGNVTLRELAIVTAFRDLINNPNPSMLNLIMERDEGRVPQQIVSASGSINDWMEYAKEQNIPLEDVMEEAKKLIAEYNQPPDIVEGEIVEEKDRV